MIRMTDPDGEVWRMTNASGNASYDLHLINDADGTSMIMQLVSVDGVSVHLPQNTPIGNTVELAAPDSKWSIVLLRRRSISARFRFASPSSS